MKRLISMLMVIIIAVSYTVFFVDAEDLKFTDVPTDAWYYNDVKNAVGMGLINGKTETTYCPDDYLTYAEAIKLAACMYDVYKNGTVTIVPGGAPWYQVYVDYAKKHGIIEMNYNYNDFATRAGYMEIFARALPKEALKEINYIPDDSIPDVKMLTGYAEEVYLLYRAGILQGSDEKHSCKPYDNIRRSEVAAILTRMMDDSKRVKFFMGTIEEKPEEEKPEGQEKVPAVEASDTETNTFTFEKELPEYTDMCVGEEVTLSVKVKGGKEPYTYKWYFGTFIIPTKDYTMAPKFDNSADVSFIMTGDYLPASDNVLTSFTCEITDADGNELRTSTGIKDITPKDMPLTIIKQPQLLTTPKYGSELYFDLEVHGGKQPYTFEWFYDSRFRNEVTQVSLNTLPQTQVRRFNSEINIALREDTTILGQEIYCVVTDAKGNTVKSEKVAVCPDYVMITLEEKTEIANIGTQYVGTVKCGTLFPGDRIGFIGYFDGKYEYVSGTVYRIVMFKKEMDKAEAGDRVGILFKNIKTYEKADDLKDIIGDPEYRTTRNIAFRLLSTAMTVTTEKNAYYVTPGNYTHLTVYITGGNEDYVSCEWFKEVEGEWVSFDKDKGATYSESRKCYWMQCTYHGEKEYASYNAKCIVTDSASNKAESNIVTLTTSDIGFETELPKETKVSAGQQLTLTVKPKGGKAPYTYEWYYKEVNPDSSSRVGYFEDIKSSTGHDTDTLMFTVSSRDITSNYGFPDEITRCVGCTITDANGAVVSTATILLP